MDFRPFMQADTFTIMGRCEKTKMLGVGMATASIATASRCPIVKARVGAVVVQATPDPRLRLPGIRLLEMGYSAPKVVQELRESDPHIEMRQIGVIDKDGNSAAYTGKENGSWAGHVAKKNYIAMGNWLASERTAMAMAESFESSVEEPLEERLMRAIEAGEAAGGQGFKGRHMRCYSAAILVCDWDVYSRVDLRVDHHAEPIGELRRILEVYKPLIPLYDLRAKGLAMTPYEWLTRHGGTEEDLRGYYLDGFDEAHELFKR